ncbi:cytochrome P450 [Acephala macrosclerotiorum]|nr:cytochrome P450 [Acephala macrosclerotiorum]
MQSFSTTLTLVVLAGAVYTIAPGIWRLYFSPIAKFPGPKLAALTYGKISTKNDPPTLWILLTIARYETYYDIFCGGEYLWKIQKLHEKYGSTISIDPHEQHVLALEGSIFASASHDLHRKRRDALAAFFSKESSRRLLPLIQERVDTMVRRLGEMKGSGKTVNLLQALLAFSHDVIMETCFGEHAHRLDNKNFDPSFHYLVMNSGKVSVLFRDFPIVLKTVFALPERMALMLPDLPTKSNKEENIEGVRNSGKSAVTDRETIFHHLLESDLTPSEKTVNRLIDEGITLVGAGSHTDAWTLTAAFATVNDGDNLATVLAQLEKLTYLTALVSPTHSPDATLRYKEWIIPPGTAVATTTPLEFKPERWLNDKDRRLDRYLTSFSAGSRVCLGISLAWAELYMTLWDLLTILELYETGKSDVEMKKDFFFATVKEGSQGVRVLVKN